MRSLYRWTLSVLVALAFAVAGCTDTPVENDANANQTQNDHNDDTTNQDDNDDNDNNDDQQNQNDNNDDCEPESEDELCDQAEYVCGEAELTDECGETRQVDCGTCTGNEECRDNQECVCIPDTCKTLPDTCGVVSDGCGGEILCSTGCENPIGIGAYHTCLMRQDGGVDCWGLNDDGQLGVATDDDGDPLDESPDGVTVQDLDLQIRQVFAGERHTCARAVDGAVYCWGDNSSRQLTELAGDNSAEPVEITNLDGPATTIGTGGFHTCAQLDPGHMQCWGINYLGQLGTGDADYYETPQDVDWAGDDDQTVAKFDGGPLFSCYLDGDHRLFCWGDNTKGQVGNLDSSFAGDPADPYAPQEVLVDVEPPIRDFSAGGVFDEGTGTGDTISGSTCAIDDTDTLKCWGYNSYGQLGIEPPQDSDDEDHSTEAVVVDELTAPRQVAVGGEHACAVDAEDDVYCWGYNEFGQLGDGTTDSTHEPVQVQGLEDDPEAIFAGTFHTCVQLEEGDFQCWGLNSHGQLGDGTTENRTEPVSVFD